MARDFNFARMDAGLFDHRKIIRLLANPDGEHVLVCWWRLVSWAKKNADPEKPGDAGTVDPAIARHVLGDGWEPVVNVLAAHGLLDAALDGSWQLHNFAKHQDLAGWARRQDKARTAGRASGAARMSQRAKEIIARMTWELNSEFISELISELNSELNSIKPNQTKPSSSNELLTATLDERADLITKIIYAKDPMIRFVAVRGIVKTALSRDHTDGEVCRSLLGIVAENRPITQETLRVSLNGIPRRKRDAQGSRYVSMDETEWG